MIFLEKIREERGKQKLLTIIKLTGFNLQLRTRSALLESLTEELQTKTAEFLGGPLGLGNSSLNVCPVSPTTGEISTSGSSGSGSRFIDTVRKALISRVRNASTESVPQQLAKKGQQIESSPPSNRQSSSAIKVNDIMFYN